MIRAAAVAFAVLLVLAAPAGAQEGDVERPDAAPPRLVRDGTARAAFGLAASPSPGPARITGRYGRGCLAGAVELPAEGPHWQTMRPSRNRAWGHPVLIGFIRDLGVAATRIGLPGILVGDMSQPRGGPMPSGHASHQVGLEVDVWFTGMPARGLSVAAREGLAMRSTLAAGGGAVDPALLDAPMRRLVRTAAGDPRVARIFVHPLVKRALCASAGNERGWLRKVRPWYGHDAHFHVRLRCPPGQSGCTPQRPPPPGDGCGADLDWWFTPAPYKEVPQAPPLRLDQMPAACIALVAPQR